MNAYLAARNPNADGFVTIKAEYSNTKKVKRVATGVKVNQKYWDNETRLVKANGTANVTKTNEQLKAVLKNLNDAVTELYKANGNVLPTVPQLNEYLAAQSEAVAAVGTEETLVAQLGTFIAGKTDWAPATVKAYNTLSNHIQGYQKAKKVTWLLTTLTNDEIIKWQHWLVKTYNFNNATLAKVVGKFKTFLTDKQPAQINLSKVKPLFTQSPTPPVVLHQNEIEALRALDLTNNPRLERVRDLQIAQIFSGLRFSDLIRLESRHIQKGHIVIKMWKTRKQNKTVRIPIFPPFAEIAAKYTDTKTGELRLPVISNQKFNDYIKEIAQLIPELLKPITIEFTKGTVTDTKDVPKWGEISSHSSRRSFCSLCLDLGYSVKETMVWSGHSTLAAFSRYIGLSDLNENAADDFTARYAAKLSKIL